MKNFLKLLIIVFVALFLFNSPADAASRARWDMRNTYKVNFALVGGGVYTLSHQPGTIIAGNVIRRMKGDYACLYADEGSAFFTFQNNVCDTAPMWLTFTGHDINITDTYTNVQSMRRFDAGIQIENTVYINGQAWTPEAQALIDNAGLEPMYSYLHNWLNE